MTMHNSTEQTKQFTNIMCTVKNCRYLLKDYDKAVRPVFNASKVVKVYIGLTLTHIFNIVSSFFDCSA